MSEENATAAEPSWPKVFHTLTGSWFRLETLQVYNVDSERDKYQEFLQTGEVESPGSDDWRAIIAGHADKGRSLRRVHIVEEPLTDYLRFEIAAYVGNNAAGEDILLLPVKRGQWPEGLPRGTDFWLFDDGLPSCTAWAMKYDDGGGFHGAELVRDPATIETFRRWRDAALSAALPLNDYLRREV